MAAPAARRQAPALRPPPQVASHSASRGAGIRASGATVDALPRSTSTSPRRSSSVATGFAPREVAAARPLPLLGRTPPPRWRRDFLVSHRGADRRARRRAGSTRVIRGPLARRASPRSRAARCGAVELEGQRRAASRRTRTTPSLRATNAAPTAEFDGDEAFEYARPPHLRVAAHDLGVGRRSEVQRGWYARLGRRQTAAAPTCGRRSSWGG